MIETRTIEQQPATATVDGATLVAVQQPAGPMQKASIAQIIAYLTSLTAYTDENARDAIGAALVAGGGIVITVNDAGDTITIGRTGKPISSVGATAFTPALGDANTHIRFTAATAVTFTVPTNAVVAFPIGTEIDFQQVGAGIVTLAPSAGVTLESRAAALATAGQFAAAQIKKVAANSWAVIGDMG